MLFDKQSTKLIFWETPSHCLPNLRAKPIANRGNLKRVLTGSFNVIKCSKTCPNLQGSVPKRLRHEFQGTAIFCIDFRCWAGLWIGKIVVGIIKATPYPKLTNSFVYEYEMNTCDSSPRIYTFAGVAYLQVRRRPWDGNDSSLIGWKMEHTSSLPHWTAGTRVNV